jgi:hypothetical protein
MFIIALILSFVSSLMLNTDMPVSKQLKKSPTCSYILHSQKTITDASIRVRLNLSAVVLCLHVTFKVKQSPNRRRLEDNIKMDLQDVGGGCVDWMERAQDRNRWRELVSTVMNFRVP